MIAVVTKDEYSVYSGMALEDMPSDIERTILRASEFIYYTCMRSFTLQATSAEYPTAIKEAVNAQVEYELVEVGEGAEREEPQGGGSLGELKWEKPPKALAPRARRALLWNGYLNRRVTATDSKVLEGDFYVE